MPLLLLLSLLTLPFTLGTAAADVPAAPPSDTLPVGVAALDISPQHPVRLSGYGFRRTESEGVAHPIWAKALAFGGPDHELTILVTVDNVGVPAAITRALASRLHRHLGLPPERLAVAASHTHTAPMLSGALPTLFGVDIPPEHQANIDRYTQFFLDRLEQVALQAAQHLRPGRLEWGRGRVGFAANRRTPGGPVDHDLPVLVVRDPDGQPRAIWFTYACHCTTLSNNKVSGDWAGWAQSGLEAAYPGALALAAIGCGADANPNQRGPGDSTAFAEAHGHQIVDEIKRLLATPLEPVTQAPKAALEHFDLPLAPARSRAEWEERARQNDAIGYHARLNLARLDRGEALPDRVPYSVQSWVFGDDLAVLFLPGEVVVDYALRLKREFDAARLAIVAYANDAPCYVPSERILREGGYEGGGAMIYYDQPQIFAPGLEDTIIQRVHQQLPASLVCPPGTEGIAPRSPNRALRSYRAPPNLTLELVAAEPLVQSPITIDWDPQGRLWVTEMLDYPAGLDGHWQPGGRIKVLTDTDGDGRLDHATVFAEPVPFPTGVLPWRHGALICAAPDLLFAQDNDGDLRADRTDPLFSGFATENFQARLNSLTLGLDNWIHGANGLLGGTIRGAFRPALLDPARPDTPTRDVDIRNRDFRFNPFTGAFEPAAGLTQHGRTRNDWGDWFGCDNSRALTQFPLAEHYLRRNPHVPSPDPIHFVPTGPDPARLFPASRLQARFNDLDMANRVTSACGIDLYRDDLLDPALRNNAFTCDNVHNLVTRLVLNSDGLLFTGQRPPEEQSSEFLASTDNWARPVQVRTGPDGALYVVDMYRFLIEHPRWIPAERLAPINVRAGADRGRIYRLVPRHRPLRPIPNLARLSTPELAQLLDHPNGPARDRVHLELLRRHDSTAVAPLRQLARSAPRPEVRLQALCLLEGLQSLTPADLLPALRDPHEQVRRHAVRLSEPWLRSPTLPSTAPDAAQLRTDVLALAADPSRAVRTQLAFSLGECPDPQAARALAQLASLDPDHPYFRAALLSAAVPHAANILSLLAAAPTPSPGLQTLKAQLATTAAATADEPGLRRTLDALLPAPDRPVSPPDLAAFVSLLESLERRHLSLPHLLTGPDAPPQGPNRLDQLLSQARTQAAHPQTPRPERELALRTLGRDPAAEDRDVQLLTSLAATTPELRSAALSTLQRLRTPAVATRLLDGWPQYSPVTRSAIVTLLLSREEWTESLLHAIEAGQVAPAEVPLADQTRCTRSPRPAIRDLAQRLFQAPSPGDRAAVVASYRPSLQMTGDPSRGRDLFLAQCASCHALDGLGFHVGPDLLTLAGKDLDYWIKNILDPNAVVVPQYVTYNLETKDDRSLSGVIQSETSTSLTLVQGGGVSETILRQDIADLRSSTLSLMPEGLEIGLPPQAMADLLAFARRPTPSQTADGPPAAPLTAADDGSFTLPAATAQIEGGDITLEAQFQNIGMWHGQNDRVSWDLIVRKAGDFDVHLDYACHNDAAGNMFLLSAGPAELQGAIAGTGGWDQYRQVKLGRLALPPGNHRVVVRPAGPLRHALMDLRTLKLTPAGLAPRWVLPSPTPPTSLPPGFTADRVARTPAAVASVILDPARPRSEREAIITANPQFCDRLIAELTRDLPPGPSEYERIPWIWRVAVAAGRRNDPTHLRRILDVSLPQPDAPLRDWQAVVLGGGLINGLSERGLAPGPRLLETTGADDPLRARWSRALDLASTMADDPNVPTPTRYDALRMLGVEPWEKRGRQLARYLVPGTHEELQMGAVSALLDVATPPATHALLDALSHLAPANRDLALDGLLRPEPSALLLLEALSQRKITVDTLGRVRLDRLHQHPSLAVRQRATQTLAPPPAR